MRLHILGLLVTTTFVSCGGSSSSGKSNASSIPQTPSYSSSTASQSPSSGSSIVSSTSSISSSVSSAKTASISFYGSWKTLEGTGVDTVFYGVEAPNIKNVTLDGVACEIQTEKSNTNTAFYRCQGPNLGAIEEDIRYVKAVVDGSEMSFGPIYFRNMASWVRLNGQYYFESMWNYVITSTKSVGPTVTLNLRSLTGNLNDIPAASYWGAISINGSSGQYKCPFSENSTYQCPPVPEGNYSVMILHDKNDSRYVVENQFMFRVVYGQEAPAASSSSSLKNGSASSAKSSSTSSISNCDPATDKGC